MAVVREFAGVLIAFFAILNPIGNLPVFVSLTRADDKGMSHAIARRALALSTAIVALFAVGGKLIFELFGIDLASFRIIGGIIIALIGYHMLQGKTSDLQHDVNPKDPRVDDALSVAVSPLAMPVLAGPGTIATAMSLAAKHGPLMVICSFALLAFLTYFLFVYGETIAKRLGSNLMNIVTRFMGLILAVVGTGMCVQGLKAAFGLG